MNRLVLAAAAVFAAFQIMDYIIHGIILMPAYEKLAHIWRPDMQEKMWIFTLSGLVMSVAFVYIFGKGYEKKGLAEGVRFGLIMGLFMNFIGSFGQYVMYPIPFGLALEWFLYGMAEFIIAGLIVAALYKPGNK